MTIAASNATVRRSAGPGCAWHWSGPPTLPAVRLAAGAVRSFLAKEGLPEPELAAWELLVTEAGNNIVLHEEGGIEGRWDVHVVKGHDRVIVRVIDSTEGFEWPETASLPDEDSESGRGLYLIFALTDFREYLRLNGGNTLTMERGLPASAARAENLEATLQALTEELASCYESLSAIFRFTAESRQAGSLEDFAGRLLKHLAIVTHSDFGILRLVVGSELITVATHGCDVPAKGHADRTPMPLEEQAVQTRQDQWIDGQVAKDGFGGAALPPKSGLVHPFFGEESLMGVLGLGRCHSDAPLTAGEVNIVHTFAEFFVQHLFSRRHEEEAIKASVARREVELAASIQQSLLPPPLPELVGLSVAGHCESALSIGGDYYDLVPWGNRGCFFAIADVMGKGVGASMMAAVTRAIVRSLNQLYQTPARLLDRAVRQLFEDLDRLEMFVTAAVGIVDSSRGCITVANAGHCPILVAAADGTVQSAGPEMPPIGIVRQPEFKEHVFPLASGTCVFAYTDGLTDPRSERPHFDSQEEVAAWFSAAVREGNRSAETLRVALLERLGHAAKAGIIADDQTFLFITNE